MASTDLTKHLIEIVGRRHVVTRAAAMRRFTKGYRFGEGSALAAVGPGTLVELWRVLKACTDADAIMIMQASNTGLTGGSTPFFYIGTNDPADLTKVRRDILSTFATLPISAEYMHRSTFDLAASHGKDMFLAIRLLGTRRLPLVNRMKEWVDRATASLPLIPANLADRLLHGIASLLPNHLPNRLLQFRDRYEHHLLIRTADETTAEMATYLGSTIPDLAADYLVCSPTEGEDAFLHRFVAAGAAVRYRALNPRTSAGLVSLDIALPRDMRDWAETLPPELARQIARSLSYGHFFCHVFHQDYVAAAGCNLEKLEEQLLAFQGARGAKYPAEHGVGHLYDADETLERHFRELDPTNSFNPGVGRLARERNWSRPASLS